MEIKRLVNKIFILMYRAIIPLLIIFSCFVVPELKFPTVAEKSPTQFVKPLLTALVALAYISVSFLDEAPSETGFFRFGLWRRFGAFRGNQFIPYFDKSSITYFYFFNAFMVSLITRVLVFWQKLLSQTVASAWNIILAMVNFLLLFVPYVVQYHSFRKHLYLS